ncbi:MULTISPECIES: helix-turn-helix domain-containing protein [Bacillus cereus group]|uniref:Helix-turn-helix domain-containing protein n=1 Tax=Bacillus cereus TaxID=1396 RepID=A0AAW5L578_BACCE|nr:MULTISPECIES: helix-turn-helix transcriptional regulator [Bacillus cereus group]MCQ6287985.1 helix-turn-helix domain-containing protein [Bacillus cereus]MCQ6318771.1 helix-turn-helix domain-containing protein [Bacillus cereus]MCQ6331683.1 helix-turn-helix domain-containing protein [Bacillus cereus]MCQ6386298.1 helix-turn-helix domain-containing protein [Bacillus cereus]
MFSQRLKELRKSKKISMRQLGEVLGVKQTSISNWENVGTEPDYTTLVRIANYFDVSTDYLLGNSADFNDQESKEKREIALLAQALYKEILQHPHIKKQIEEDLLQYVHFLGYKNRGKGI